MTTSPNTAGASRLFDGGATRARRHLPVAPAFPRLRVLDLFSGIGGFSLGLERTGGFETVAFCEIEEFPRRVLAKHWPGVPCYHDVRDLTAARLAADGIAVDVITGGFPCQDISVAGKQAGIGEGTRSGLWSEIIRLVGELRPDYLIVENVANLLSGPREKRGGWFGRILGDLAELGYDAEWENIPAAAVGAPHRRERVWIVAYHDKTAVTKNTDRREERQQNNWTKVRLITSASGKNVADANRHHAQGEQSSRVNQKERERQVTRQVGPLPSKHGGVWLPEPDVGRVAHGVPNRVDRLGGLGNAVVPQIPELIGRAILEAEAAE